MDVMVGKELIRTDIGVTGHQSNLNATGSYNYRERWCLRWRSSPGNTEVSCRSPHHRDTMRIERMNIILGRELSVQLRPSCPIEPQPC